MAGDGMRVLGVAFHPLEALPTQVSEELERELIFVGLVGMIDPPRPEVREAVATCRTIRPVMITGDHPLAALHIARQLGLGEGAGQARSWRGCRWRSWGPSSRRWPSTPASPRGTN